MTHLPDPPNADDRPLYAQISGALERAIEAGELAPGDRVPGENVLMDRYGVARETARKALEQLAQAGLIDKRRGSGTFVREQRKLERKPRRYRRKKQLGEFASDVLAAGRDPNVEAVSTRVAATSSVAERLGVEPGSEVMKTEYVFKADGEPIQASTSYEPLDVTGGTSVELPEEGQYANAGVINRMDAIGIAVTRVSEEVEVRPPRSHEAYLLNVDPGVHVFCIRRTFSTDERVVETADIVIPGDRYSLNYEFLIADEDDPVTA